MAFSNNVSYMVKILTFYIIMTRNFTVLKNLTISLKFYIILMSVGNQKTTTNDKVRAIKKRCTLDPHLIAFKE